MGGGATGAGPRHSRCISRVASSARLMRSSSVSVRVEAVNRECSARSNSRMISEAPLPVASLISATSRSASLFLMLIDIGADFCIQKSSAFCISQLAVGRPLNRHRFGRSTALATGASCRTWIRNDYKCRALIHATMSRPIPLRSFASSSIIAPAYDSERRVLRLQYSGGGTYDYYLVPADVFQRFLDAPSKGQFVNWHIKPYYPYIRLS